MRRDDQVMRAAGRPGPAGVRDQPRVIGGGGFGVIKNIDGRRDGDEGAGAIGRAAGSVSKLDADPLLSNGDGCDRQLVGVQDGRTSSAWSGCG